MRKVNGIKLSLITLALISSFNANAASVLIDSTGTSSAPNSGFAIGLNNQVGGGGGAVGINNTDTSVLADSNTTFGLFNNTDGASNSLVGGFLNNTGSNNTVNGFSSTVNSNDSVVIGNDHNVSGSSNVDIGSVITDTGIGNINLGGNITNSANNSVVYGSATAPVTNTRNDTVNVGNRTISNVANGTQANDAVNFQQLQAGLASVSGGGSAYDDSGIRNSIAQTNGRVDRLEGQINSVERKLSGGIASVAAMQTAPLVQGKTTMAFAGAQYNGEYAMGASLTKDMGDNTAFTAGIALSTTGHPVIRVGYMIVF